MRTFGWLLVLPALLVAGSARADASGPPNFVASYPSAPQGTNLVPRSPVLRALGIGLCALGGGSVIAAPIVGSTSTSPSGDPRAASTTDGAVFGLAIAGIALVALGIPVALYGSEGVPPSTARLRSGPRGVAFAF